jgi:flagellar basal-body rod protein FlgG
MIKALYTAATGMRANQTRIDVISNNLANVNTSGFKKSTVNFQDLLYSTLEQPGAQNADGSTRPTGLQVGAGSRLVSTAKVYTPGVLEETGRELDLTISGDGFYKFQDLAGGAVYSRDGNLHIDADGQMVNSEGLKLDPALTIPQGAKVAIGPDGTITSKVGDETATTVGRITLSSFRNPSGLEAVGNNLLRESAASGPAISGNPGEQGFGSIIQGFLERSNVEVVDELVDLIVAQRAYEINSRAIRAADDMLTTVNQTVQ